MGGVHDEVGCVELLLIVARTVDEPRVFVLHGVRHEISIGEVARGNRRPKLIMTKLLQLLVLSLQLPDPFGILLALKVLLGDRVVDLLVLCRQHLLEQVDFRAPFLEFFPQRLNLSLKSFVFLLFVLQFVLVTLHIQLKLLLH